MKRFNYKETVYAETLAFAKAHLTICQAYNWMGAELFLLSNMTTKYMAAAERHDNSPEEVFQAEERVCHNLSLLSDVVKDMGVGYSHIGNAIWCDNILRLHFVGIAVIKVIDDLRFGFTENTVDESGGSY